MSRKNREREKKLSRKKFIEAEKEGKINLRKGEKGNFKGVRK